MDNKIFGEILKEARKHSGISEREAAKYIDVSNSTWARWERSETYPGSFDTLDKICDLLNLNFFDMITVICPEVKKSHMIEFQILESLSNMNKQDFEAIYRIIKAVSNS